MNYRGIDQAVNLRNPNMSRPKKRPPFKHNCDPMPSAGRARYIPPNIQQTQYSPSDGYQCNVPYCPEYTVPYSPHASAPPGWNHQSIPITMAETYMPNQHAYQSQGYNTKATHMIAIPNGAFIPQVQNQNDFDPVANMCICPKCQFMNSLAHLQLKSLTEENKRLHEQLKDVEQQLSNANDEDGVSTQVSSLTVDDQPFQMGATQEQSKPHQGTNAVLSTLDPCAQGKPCKTAHCTRTSKHQGQLLQAKLVLRENKTASAEKGKAGKAEKGLNTKVARLESDLLEARRALELYRGKKWECPVCLEPRSESKRMAAVPCGHVFCRPCIVQVARSSEMPACCPLCQEHFCESAVTLLFLDTTV